MSCDFTHKQNLRNKTNTEKRKTTLLTVEITLMVTRGEVGWGVGEIGDGN